MVRLWFMGQLTMIIVQLRNIVCRRTTDANSISVSSRVIDPISGCSLRDHGMLPRDSPPRSFPRSRLATRYRTNMKSFPGTICPHLRIRNLWEFDALCASSMFSAISCLTLPLIRLKWERRWNCTSNDELIQITTRLDSVPLHHCFPVPTFQPDPK